MIMRELKILKVVNIAFINALTIIYLYKFSKENLH